MSTLDIQIFLGQALELQTKLKYEILPKLYALKCLRLVEVHSGFHPIDEIINQSGLPLLAKSYSGYSWETLKSWMQDPSLAVICKIPTHAILIFAIGEKKGRYRHVLIGRASGGQSPCSWIPFSEDDIHPKEKLWQTYSLLNKLSNKPLILDQCGRKGGYQAIVVKRKELLKYSPFDNFKYFVPPNWLKSRELVCNTCFLHKQIGDSVMHPKERLAWFNS